MESCGPLPRLGGAAQAEHPAHPGRPDGNLRQCEPELVLRRSCPGSIVGMQAMGLALTAGSSADGLYQITECAVMRVGRPVEEAPDQSAFFSLCVVRDGISAVRTVRRDPGRGNSL